MKKGAMKEKRTNAYLEKFYLTLRRPNDGLEASRKLPEYIKKQWREALWTKDNQTTYLSYVSANATGDRRQVSIWPHPSSIERTILQLITTYVPGSKVRPKRQLIIIIRSFPRGTKTTIGLSIRRISPWNSSTWCGYHLTCQQSLFLRFKEREIRQRRKRRRNPCQRGLKFQRESDQRKGLNRKGVKKKGRDINPKTPREKSHMRKIKGAPIVHRQPFSSRPLHCLDYPSIDSTFDIVPPPSLQKVREKRKVRFTPMVQVLDNTLTTRSARNLISGTAQELATRVEELELELVQQVHQPCFQQSKPPWSWKFLSTFPAGASPKLAARKVSLEEEYDELLGVIDQEQRTRKEATVLQLKEEVDSMQSKFLFERETCLGESEENMHLNIKGLSSNG
eukprot:Gb_21683 [translate_table: standard]